MTRRQTKLRIFDFEHYPNKMLSAILKKLARAYHGDAVRGGSHGSAPSHDNAQIY